MDFKGSFIPEGIPAFIPATFGIMSEDVPEFGAMSGKPGCSMPPPEGGVADVGGVFMLGLLCEPGAGMVFCML